MSVSTTLVEDSFIESIVERETISLSQTRRRKGTISAKELSRQNGESVLQQYKI